MTTEQHLTLHELLLAPSGEWVPRGEGWIILRVAEGFGYLLQRGGGVREFGAGDCLVMAHRGNGSFRASRLGPLKLQFYLIDLQSINGLFTLAEGRQLEAAFDGTPPHVSVFTSRERIALEFARIAAQPRTGGLPDRCQLVQLWAGAVTSLLAAPAVASANAGELRERLRQLIGQMSEADLAECPLRDLAGRLHCSERHFGRLFREEFGVPFHQRQIELRLLRARQLLTNSNAKIVNVAYDSGYRHLGLFNTMFKKRFGMTPGEWRRQNSRENIPARPRTRPLQLMARASVLFLVLVLNLLTSAFAQTNAPTSSVPTTSVPSTNRPASTAPVRQFEVQHYQISGDSVLQPETIGKVLSGVTNAFGKDVSIDGVRSGLLALQKAYRDRGYVTVAVTLPQQQLTNETVKVKITEGRLATINVVGNRYYSSNNVMRALPSLHTNIILNSFVLQGELDAANASRDRQIYPILGPGPEPGTSALTLQVKDRLPLHSRFELDNDNTPGTPALRANFNAQYDNLWDLNHQAGLQYSFSPEVMKYMTEDEVVPFDAPLIANYSAYYRIPIGHQSSVENDIEANPSRFGYNEASHRFDLPVVTSAPTLTIFASRATTDTGIQLGPLNQVVTNNPLLSIQSQTVGENTTVNEDIGARFSLPVPSLDGVKFTLSGGLDYKQYQTASFNTNDFYEQVTFTNQFGSVTTNYTISSGQPARHASVEYLPFNLGADIVVPDKLGTSFFNLSANFNVLPVFSDDAAFSRIAYTTNAGAKYFYLKMGFNREQQIYKDWSVLLRAGGQWASGPLIDIERFPLGGVNSVRGYHEGEIYGDSGWNATFEPHTPLWKIATVGGEGSSGAPCSVRFSTFLDYGQAYLKDPAAFIPDHITLAGAGVTSSMNIGEHLGAQIIVGCPLKDSPETKAGTWRVNFSLSAQF